MAELHINLVHNVNSTSTLQAEKGTYIKMHTYTTVQNSFAGVTMNHQSPVSSMKHEHVLYKRNHMPPSCGPI